MRFSCVSHSLLLFNLRTFNQRPSFGVITNSFLAISNFVFEHVENSKLRNKDIKPILACIIPNFIPMQFLGPLPNGKNANGCRFLISSGVKRVGSNLSGSG